MGSHLPTADDEIGENADKGNDEDEDHPHAFDQPGRSWLRNISTKIDTISHISTNSRKNHNRS